MMIDKIKDMGYKVNKNYIINEKPSLNYKIRLFYPYGFNRKDLCIYPYISIFLAVMDKYYDIPVNIEYEVGPNFTVIKCDVFNINHVPILLAGMYNFMETVEVEKMFEEMDDSPSLFSLFVMENEKLYNEGRYETLSVNGVPVPELMYDEYQFLSTKSEEEIIKKFKLTKSFFSEDKSLVFIQGRDVKKLNFKSHDLEYDKIDNTGVDVFNRYITADGSRSVAVPINEKDGKSKYVLYRMVFEFISILLDNGNILDNNPRLLVFWCNIHDVNTFSPEWIDDNILNNQESMKIYFKDFKILNIKKLLDEFENLYSDVDILIHCMISHELLFSLDELQEEIVNMMELTFEDFLKNVIHICNILYKKPIKKEEDEEDYYIEREDE